MNQKIIIAIANGEVSGWQIPKGVVVEIRDYDCPEDWADLKIDEDGDKYQRVLLSP